MRRWTFLLTIPMFSLACASTGEVKSSEIPLELDVTVEEQAVDGTPHTVAAIHVTNSSNQSIAWSPTFGFSHLYLSLEIRGDLDERISYPEASQYELFSVPRHRCLKPGETETVRVDLFSWYHILGGELRRETVAEAGPYEFNLTKGQYRIRARYSPPVSDSGRCQAAAAQSESEWALLTIEYR